ncbi:unnamed protein product [Urochloa humidicola]
MGGGMEVHKNRWIEEWNAGRENLEFNFRWTRRSLAVVGLFGIAVPILVYKGIVREFGGYEGRSHLIFAKASHSHTKIEVNGVMGVMMQYATSLLTPHPCWHPLRRHMQDEDAERPLRKFL